MTQIADETHHKRIAVVGAGISGLGTAWLLNRAGHRVTLFEKEPRAGGHTLTDDSGPVPVDLGFQVFNLTTYPHLVGFLECLGVDTEPSDMSFGLSLDRGKLEWASHGLASIFAQKSNLLDLRFWMMVYQVVKFGRKAPEVLLPENAERYRGMTLSDYIDRERYGTYFKKYYLLPMCAAVWSVSFETVLGFPITVLVRFWVNHHLLDLFQRPVWRVIKGRSVNYVEAILKDLPDIRLSNPVASVRSTEDNRLEVKTSTDIEIFDVVVMATHSDIGLKILGDAIDNQTKSVLEAIPYRDNEVVLHTDASLMPKLSSVWASWNFIASSEDANDRDVCVSYWLNRLQNLDETIPPMFVTLNPPPGLPRHDSIIRRYTLSHPIFLAECVEAQEKLEELQGKKGIYFVGAWCGYGFHEDGIASAVSVCSRLGSTVPWNPISVSPKSTWMESFWLRTFDAFANAGIKEGYLRFVLPDGSELSYGNRDVASRPSADWRQPPSLSVTVRVFSLDLFKKIVFRLDTGLAEAYMDGDFSVDSLNGLMAVLVGNARHLGRHLNALGIWSCFGNWSMMLSKSRRGNTIQGSRRNIEAHYDIGNDYYKLFLDETMTYSCGLFAPGSSLLDSQLRKLDAVIWKLNIQSSDHVLEIGCGWGSFAIRAARTTGCRVTGLTISQEQLKEAQHRIREAGLQDQIRLLFCDYRHCPGLGTYDKLVSIEMIEAVGQEHLEAYFEIIGRSVKPGGTVFIQAITVPDERYTSYCASSDFIREHIFPGGHMPCMDVIASLAAKNKMMIVEVEDIGLDYAITLRHWRRRWSENKERAMEMGTQRLHRMFEIYFAYCEAGFEGGYIQTQQVVLQKDVSIASAVDETPQKADLFTQVLLAVYFFLAGIVVTNRPYMWLAPIASSVLVSLFAFSSQISSLFQFYKRCSTNDKVWWTTYVVRIIYGIFMSLLATVYTWFNGYLTQSSSHPPSMIRCAPVCIALGFCGFQVWNVVYHRLYISKPSLLARYTFLLILLCVTAYKMEQVELTTALLMTEWNVIFDQLLRIFNVLGWTAAMPYVSIFEKITFLLFKVTLQSTVLFGVFDGSIEFGSKWSHYLTLLGLFVSTSINLGRVLSTKFFSVVSLKEHAQ